MARKESSELREIIQQARIPSKVAKKILAVPELFGKAEVLKQAGHLVNGSATERALAHLEEVYQLLVDYGYREHLIIDLGEIRGFDYYTGIVFEVFAKGLGYAFGVGVWYDPKCWENSWYDLSVPLVLLLISSASIMSSSRPKPAQRAKPTIIH